MFEHVRNHHRLFSQIASWLKPEAKVFIHIFAHHTHAFLYEAEHEDDWMARYFFFGGIMPSADLLPLAAKDFFSEEQRWNVNGCHYQKALDAWLALHDAKRSTVMETLRPCYGIETNRWFHRWRLFYLACSELFGYNAGEEWSVLHYRFALQTQSMNPATKNNASLSLAVEWPVPPQHGSSAEATKCISLRKTKPSADIPEP